MTDLSGKKLVYVAGYGRSGSTMLCAVLGSTASAISVGEFRRLFGSFRQKKVCACGHVMGECELWKPVLERFFKENPTVTAERAEKITKRCEKARLWPWSGKATAEDLREYEMIWSSLITITCDVAQVDVLVDSSKSSMVSADRATLLSRLLPVHHVFLVRDPRAVVLSALNSQKKREGRLVAPPNRLRVPQSLLGWSITNLYFLWVSGRRDTLTSIVVRYEDMTNQADVELSRIQERFSWSLEPVKEAIAKGQLLSAGHVFSGDGMRKGGGYRIGPVTEKWKENLPGAYKVLSYAVYPLARYFGYMKKAN